MIREMTAIEAIAIAVILKPCFAFNFRGLFNKRKTSKETSVICQIEWIRVHPSASRNVSFNMLFSYAINDFPVQ